MSASQAQGYNSLRRSVFLMFSTDQLWYWSDCRPRKLYFRNTFLANTTVFAREDLSHTCERPLVFWQVVVMKWDYISYSSVPFGCIPFPRRRQRKINFSEWTNSSNKRGKNCFPCSLRDLSVSFEEWTSSLSAAITDWRFFIPLLIWATVFSALCQDETRFRYERWNKPGYSRAGECVKRQVFVFTLTSSEESWAVFFLLSSVTSLSQKKSGPESHLLLLSNWLAVSERDASSAGLSFPGTWCLCCGSLRSRMCCTLFPTKTWKRRASLLM